MYNFEICYIFKSATHFFEETLRAAHGVKMTAMEYIFYSGVCIQDIRSPWSAEWENLKKTTKFWLKFQTFFLFVKTICDFQNAHPGIKIQTISVILTPCTAQSVSSKKCTVSLVWYKISDFDDLELGVPYAHRIVGHL